MGHLLCLPFSNGIRMSIESGIDLTRRGNALRDVLYFRPNLWDAGITGNTNLPCGATDKTSSKSIR
jgi:hypothetical protein